MLQPPPKQVKELAKSGHAESLDTLLNYFMQPIGNTAKSSFKHESVEVILQGVRVTPERKQSEKYIKQLFDHLQIPRILEVKIFAKDYRSQRLAWWSRVKILPVMSTLQSESNTSIVQTPLTEKYIEDTSQINYLPHTVVAEKLLTPKLAAFEDLPNNLDYGFLLLAHIICADGQIHNQELKALKDLGKQAKIDESTFDEVEKILGQDETQITLEKCAQKISIGQRSEVFKQVLAISYIDGYFSPLEREIVNNIAQMWGISEYEIEQMLEYAQGFSQGQTTATTEKSELSVGAMLLKGAGSLLSKSLVMKLTELAPEHIGEKIEQLQREILLSGQEYDDAIQRCSYIAQEDFQYANQALKITFSSLKNLGNGLQQGLLTIKQKTVGSGEYKTAKDVATQLEQTRQSLLGEILHNLESVRESLRAKQRSLRNFSIAFMGRTKAGKSTLHAVITREGWESISIGKQRTTRYNRVYEWKNIRIIDTPGIGAPGGKTDEEIAASVIEESDVICYVVTDDSIQESEFQFLKLLKEKTKPLIILLNIQENLRDSRRLERFLKDPDRKFAKDGKSGITGHLNRIQRYAQEHYSNEYLTIIPVMLLAAQMEQEPEHRQYAKQLFKASRIQDFLDSIRLSLVDYGVIRRSQTLLGSTVASIDSPYRWITQQVTAYQALSTTLQYKRQELKGKLKKAEQDRQEELKGKIREVFKVAFEHVTPFAESHWDMNESDMKNGWKKTLNNLAFEARIKTAIEESSQEFQYDVREAIEEIGNELKIINQLQSNNFSFSAQDSNFFDKNFVKVTGMVMVAAGAVLMFIFPPLGILTGVVGGVIGMVSGWFKSRDQKRREAVNKISENLRTQLENYQSQILPKAKENFEKYCESVASAVDDYFQELIQGIDQITNQLKLAQGKLSNAANYLNRAYAKRIIDWATDQSESLNDTCINKTIRKVNRNFGKSFDIQTTATLSFTKSPEEICTILQEKVSIHS